MYKTLIVVDGQDLSLSERFPNVLSFETYLQDYPQLNESKTRLINLCDTQTYLSRGYYCSLLAEARNHLVLPSVKTINDLRAQDASLFVGYERELNKLPLGDQAVTFQVFFGQVSDAQFKDLATRLFRHYAAPILNVTVSKSSTRAHVKVARGAFGELDADAREQCLQALDTFTQDVWRISEKKKPYRWDMAILVDPAEKVPPSDKSAIAKFIKAAGKYGINAQALSINEIDNIAYYDALFIRETTAIDHHTYRIAARAEQNGLVVMDDARSILRCCNKVFLHDAFTYQKVPSLRTEVVISSDDESLDAIEEKFTYPLVLKMPEGSFSRGVFKVKSREELKEKLDELLAESALVLAQEYMFTEFDWRVGILNGRALYASRYLMARNHWQIYNHEAKRFFSGGFETLPTFEVPKRVLDAALRAAKIIGNGLYGVDVKEVNGRAYVLEVNDNPSIDHKVEDAYLGDELYMQIMGEFHRRLEARGR